ncbi:MAG: hypothetical protein ACK2UP_14000 [Candidatus Promineifilaceae bacterium]
MKYNTGRDTVEAFGDGRYQVLQLPETKVLYDLQEQQEILRHVTRWRKEGDIVYLMAGERGPFAAIYLSKGTFEKYSDLALSPKSMSTVFESLMDP